MRAGVELVDKCAKIMYIIGGVVKMIKSNSQSVLERMRLSKAVADGYVCRVGRGLYRKVDEVSEYEDYAVAVYRRPKAVICLLSALQFHGLTTQMPQQVWIALPPNASRPRNSSLRVAVLSGVSYEIGQERHVIAGEEVLIYSAAKSVVDAFKFRNKIGLDVALEALHMALQDKKVSMDELVKVATACRMLKVMTPYMEGFYG